MSAASGPRRARDFSAGWQTEGRLHLPAGDESPLPPARRARHRHSRLQGLVQRRRAQRLLRCRDLHAPRAHACDQRLRHPGVRRRGPLPRGPGGRPFGDLAVPAFGLRRAPTAGLQVPLSGRLCAVPGTAAPSQAPLHHLRRLEHRPQADRPAQLAVEPEELRLPARGARLAGPAVRSCRVRRCVPRGEHRSRTSTRGGRTAARRAPTTSAGASITRS